MKAEKKREIVIEFERVQMIRKRAKTTLASCDECGEERDVVSLTEAAELFETAQDNLFRFIKQNDCHYHVSDNSSIYLCIASLIERMQQKHSIRQLMA